MAKAEGSSEFYENFVGEAGDLLPPAVVVDLGYIAKRGWAIVEFNPLWCSGLLGADPDKVLPALARASRDLASLTQSDRRWTRTNEQVHVRQPMTQRKRSWVDPMS